MRKDAQRYGALHERVVLGFRSEFITATGRVSSATQTAHVLVLQFELAEEAHRPRIAKDLNRLVTDNGMHLSTGFLGTPHLCFALSDHGYPETAVKLLLQEEYPGWLYPISRGATTIWEHWDGIKKDGTFWSDDMNSFNHYAYGAIGEWMYTRLAGLDQAVSLPGYEEILIRPLVGAGGLSSAKALHESMRGTIESSWRVQDGHAEVKAVIPPNARAEIRLPGVGAAEVAEGGQPLLGSPDIVLRNEDSDGIVLEVGSGSYEFRYPLREAAAG